MTAGGILFAVVGASGVGKDSVIGFARAQLEADDRFLFVRRVISRPADSAGEDHAAVSPAEFAALNAQGAFCVSWQAHGLDYGLPTALAAHIAEGGHGIANFSRRAIAAAEQVFSRLQVVEITARPEVIAHRLAARGRETEAEIARRLKRRIDAHRATPGMITIENNGRLEDAGAQFLRLIRERTTAQDA